MKRVLQGLIFLFVSFAVNVTLADPPGPPGPGGDPVSGGGVPVGGPVGSGVLIMIGLCVIYASYRFYKIRSKKIKEELTD